MTVNQKFVYTFKDGTPINPSQHLEIKNKWLESLSPEEKEEYNLANIRQKQLRQQVIESGNLSVNGNVYVWKDPDAYNTNKQSDEIFLKYFDRYLAETNMQVTIVAENN